MPIFPWPAPGEVPPIGDPAFDSLLEGNLTPEKATAGLRTAAEVIAALHLAPIGTELAAEASTLAVFRGEGGMPDDPTRSRLRRHPLLGSLLSVKLGAAIALTAVGLGGGAAAAYTGALPASIQQLAHKTIGAPAARPTPTATPAGPNAAGHPAYGLCTAYAHMKAHGTAAQKAVAFRNLAAAAGGAANVTAYCAAVPHPGTSPAGRPTSLPSQAASHPTGQPTSLPSQAASHPTGQPTSLPSQAASHPTGRPTGHPTGQPASTH